MTSDLHVILVSPGAHYPSHHWTDTLELMRALQKSGQNVRTILFSPPPAHIPPDLKDRVEFVFSRAPRLLEKTAAAKWEERRFGGAINAFETIACLLKAFSKSKNTDGQTVIHFVGGFYWIAILAAIVFRHPRFIFSIYGGILEGEPSGLKGLIRPPLKKLIQLTASTGRLDFICETELLYDQILPLLGAHIHVIPYAINDSEELPARADARKRLGLSLDEKIILFFGTHRREKDYHTALRGCLALPKPPLALFVGKVISSNDPKQVIADCGYPNALVVDGFVPEEKVKDYFAASDTVALPYEAGFSRGSGVLIECCRFKRPMIASATPYFSPFVERYKCGVTYIPTDSSSFAQAAERIFSNPGSFQDGLERARHEHSWSSASGQYTKLYNGQTLIKG